MQPVVRMRFVVHAFLNGSSCVYVEPVNRSTYVVPQRNGKFFLAPIVYFQKMSLLITVIFGIRIAHSKDHGRPVIQSKCPVSRHKILHFLFLMEGESNCMIFGL